MIETLISRFNFVVVNIGELSRIPLLHLVTSSLHLAMCSADILAHFTWILPDDLCGNDYF